eukprot:scaffold926_cov408-Prasinococcus_capsulatus_cf.AAC.29
MRTRTSPLPGGSALPPRASLEPHLDGRVESSAERERAWSGTIFLSEPDVLGGRLGTSDMDEVCVLRCAAGYDRRVAGFVKQSTPRCPCERTSTFPDLKPPMVGAGPVL